MSRCQQVDDLLYRLVGAVVGGFELAGGLVMGIGAVVKAAVGEGSAQPFGKNRKSSATWTAFGVSR